MCATEEEGGMWAWHTENRHILTTVGDIETWSISTTQGDTCTYVHKPLNSDTPTNTQTRNGTSTHPPLQRHTHPTMIRPPTHPYNDIPAP